MDNATTEFMIFSGIFKLDEGARRRRQELVTTFPTATVFKDEYHIFYLISKDCIKINPTKQFIELYMRTNKAIFLKNPNVDLARFRISDVEPYVEFANSCVKLFEECSKVTVTDEEFYRNMEMHKMTYINMQSIGILEESAQILAEGVSKGNRVLSGYEDMRHNLKNQFLKIDNMMNKSDRKGLITYGFNDDEEEQDSRLNLITTFGIEELDEAIGGIYEGDMVSILAPAKGCKSRFATYVLHNAIVNHGANVLMWSIENGYKGWETLIRARHFNYFYNKNITDSTQKRFIDNDMIRKGEMSEELRGLELASWTDLKCNTNYGKFASIDEDFDADNFLEILDNAVNATGATLVCIDYLQLVSSTTSRMSKNELIGHVYKQVLQYLKRKKIGGIFPAQLKQTVVGDLKTTDPTELINKDLRDGAGESYEVIKTPDVNLALFGTVSDIRNGNMKILSIPSRNSATFEPIDTYVDAGSCTFASLRKD